VKVSRYAGRTATKVTRAAATIAARIDRPTKEAVLRRASRKRSVLA
jgi:hypothetical protein